MNRHRKAIYAMRREILRAEDISPRVKKLIEEEVAEGWLANHPESTSETYEAISNRSLSRLMKSHAGQAL